MRIALGALKRVGHNLPGLAGEDDAVLAGLAHAFDPPAGRKVGDGQEFAALRAAQALADGFGHRQASTFDITNAESALKVLSM